MTPFTGVSEKGSNVLSNLLMYNRRKDCCKDIWRERKRKRDRQKDRQTHVIAGHWAAITPSTGFSAKGSKVLSNILMNKKRKECYKDIERQTNRHKLPWTLHWAAITPSTGVSAKGSNLCQTSS
jgi:hypothetical protein